MAPTFLIRSNISRFGIVRYLIFIDKRYLTVFNTRSGWKVPRSITRRNNADKWSAWTFVDHNDDKTLREGDDIRNNYALWVHNSSNLRSSQGSVDGEIVVFPRFNVIPEPGDGKSVTVIKCIATSILHMGSESLRFEPKPCWPWMFACQNFPCRVRSGWRCLS